MSDVHCLEKGCKFGRKDTSDDDMLRCCLCCTWFHLKCVNLSSEERGVWPCPKCRKISKNITALDTKLDLLLNTVKQSMDSMKALEAKYRATETELEKSKNECVELQEENKGLRGKVSELTNKIEKTLMEHLNKNKSSLLIGDSIIKSIDPQKLNNTQVIAFQDAKVSDLSKKLDESEKSYSKVYICAGNSNCAANPMDTDIFQRDFKELIEIAKTKVMSHGDIMISSVPPRTDSSDKMKNVESANQVLENLTRENGTSFVNADAVLKLGDGSICEAFLNDEGSALNDAGVLKMIKKLHVPVKPEFETNIFKSRQLTAQEKQDSWQIQRPRRKSQNQHHQRHQTKQGGNFSHPRGDDMSTSKMCGFCGESNHSEDRCRYGEPVTCYTCGGKGHKAKLHLTT